jgi:hypothetical protein
MTSLPLPVVNCGLLSIAAICFWGGMIRIKKAQTLQDEVKALGPLLLAFNCFCIPFYINQEYVRQAFLQLRTEIKAK